MNLWRGLLIQTKTSNIHKHINLSQRWSVIYVMSLAALSWPKCFEFKKKNKKKNPSMNRLLHEHDIRFEILTHFRTPRLLAMMCLVNKSLSEFLLSPTGGRFWMAAAETICGEMDMLPSITPHADDERYIAKLRLGPRLSTPMV